MIDPICLPWLTEFSNTLCKKALLVMNRSFHRRKPQFYRSQNRLMDDHRYFCSPYRVNPSKMRKYLAQVNIKKYFTEKNALTVMVAVFCFVMMIISFAQKQSLWETIAFALAFSLAVEVICHRAKEK
jgi:hypothetical protein